MSSSGLAYVLHMPLSVEPSYCASKVALIYAMSRLMPGRALEMINGFIPDNVEELLSREG